jgi:DNA-binding NtrC family response regulator
MTFCRRDTITRKDIEFIPIRGRARRENAVPASLQADSLAAGPMEGAELLHPEAPSQFERERIEQAITAASGDKNQAAQILGMGRSTLFRKIKELGITS